MIPGDRSHIITSYSTIPLSDSDRLLHTWGYDLISEYASIAELIPRTDTVVLELATGTGRMCAVLSHLFHNVISGDISLKDLPRTRHRISHEFNNRVKFVQLNMEHLPFRSDSIRTIVCINTLHELSAPKRCIDEMIRVLHPDGRCFIGDFTSRGFSVMQKLHEQIYHNNHAVGTLRIHDAEEILRQTVCSLELHSTPLNLTVIAHGKK